MVDAHIKYIKESHNYIDYKLALSAVSPNASIQIAISDACTSMERDGSEITLNQETHTTK